MMTAGSDPHTYCPIYALPYWGQIGEFIHDSVTEAAAATGRDERSLYAAATPMVLWCWKARGMPLERLRVFQRSTIDEFIHLGMTTYARGSRATLRASLCRMAEVLNPDDAVRHGRPICRSDPIAPYSAREVVSLYSWANTQTTDRRRSDGMALLALGLGAGLATRELLEIRAQDVTSGGAGLTITVRGTRPRAVPLFEDWERPLLRILTDLKPEDWLFRQGRTAASPGQVTDFLTRSRTNVDVRPSRMRTTWLLRHLIDGTPPRDLLRISGLLNLAALDKIAEYLPRRD